VIQPDREAAHAVRALKLSLCGAGSYTANFLGAV
jgi:hypothetical protein